jgi:F-type H+-transporting ATPase subunit gamma
MPNLKEVRNRISSVSSTQQITKAMKMVSAAKLRRAQDAVVQMRPYANKLKEILENLSASLDNSEGSIYAKARPVNKVLFVAITSNRGLCGAFNSNVLRTMNRLLNTEYSALSKAGKVRILSIGKKASDLYSKNKAVYYGNHNQLYADLTFNKVAPVAEEIMKSYAAGEYDKVVIIYNHFKNAAVQNIMVEQLLPIVPPPTSETGSKKKVNDYIFEPGQEYIVQELIPKSVKVQLYKAILDSHAAEHGARMTAMSKATDNAGELLKALKLSYNKARQAAITNEILEIVGGANALKG